MRATKAILVALGILIVSTAVVGAADYIGAAKCKMCHKLQYESWSGLDHAKAFEQLKPEDQGNAECLKCHATGGSADLPGVQCEACHGPGSDYKSMKVMKDVDAAVAAGLVIPNEQTCLGCHTGAPHEQPEFDYATAVKKGVHAHKTE
jgi:nitrate/TMAO reductase-like tetraheme cytochrome c subunit